MLMLFLIIWLRDTIKLINPIYYVHMIIEEIDRFDEEINSPKYLTYS